VASRGPRRSNRSIRFETSRELVIRPVTSSPTARRGRALGSLVGADHPRPEGNMRTRPQPPPDLHGIVSDFPNFAAFFRAMVAVLLNRGSLLRRYVVGWWIWATVEFWQVRIGDEGSPIHPPAVRGPLGEQQELTGRRRQLRTPGDLAPEGTRTYAVRMTRPAPDSAVGVDWESCASATDRLSYERYWTVCQ